VAVLSNPRVKTGTAKVWRPVPRCLVPVSKLRETVFALTSGTARPRGETTLPILRHPAKDHRRAVAQTGGARFD